MEKAVITKEIVQKKSKMFELVKSHPDFVVDGNSVMLKDTTRTIPALLIERFGQLLENRDTDEYISLVRFWQWLCLNPNPEVVKELFDFLSRHTFKINKYGCFFAYRSVVKVEGGNSELTDFVTNSYNKIKAWKKSPKKFCVLEEKGVYSLGKMNTSSEFSKWSKGNLADLYEKIGELSGHTYTDNNTKTWDYRPNTTISMPREDGDSDKNRDCSTGFHHGNNKFGFDGFGNVRILTLINPKDVISVNWCGFQ